MRSRRFTLRVVAKVMCQPILVEKPSTQKALGKAKNGRRSWPLGTQQQKASLMTKKVDLKTFWGKKHVSAGRFASGSPELFYHCQSHPLHGT